MEEFEGLSRLQDDDAAALKTAFASFQKTATPDLHELDPEVLHPPFNPQIPTPGSYLGTPSTQHTSGGGGGGGGGSIGRAVRRSHITVTVHRLHCAGNSGWWQQRGNIEVYSGLV